VKETKSAATEEDAVREDDAQSYRAMIYERRAECRPPFARPISRPLVCRVGKVGRVQSWVGAGQAGEGTEQVQRQGAQQADKRQCAGP